MKDFCPLLKLLSNRIIANITYLLPNTRKYFAYQNVHPDIHTFFLKSLHKVVSGYIMIIRMGYIVDLMKDPLCYFETFI